MTIESLDTARDANGDWRPAEPIKVPPIVSWPPRPLIIAKWMFGFPGYLWPMNSVWFAVSLVTWVFLTPELAAMKSFELWWIALLFARNFGFVLVLFGGLHLYFYVFKKQGDERRFSDKPFATNTKRFLFGDQVRDNMFRTLGTAVPIMTAYEVVTYWLFANSYLGFVPFEANSVGFWVWFGMLLVFAPVIHALHFYFTHRALHWRPLYKSVHRIHHLNVEVGPWSGIAMHPVEQVIYFSTVCVQWLLALHPVNALYQIHLAAFLPAMSHSGYERLTVNGKDSGWDSGSYFHYLHHKYFECNYGGSIAPMDQLFGTFHDGSSKAQTTMRERMRARRGIST
jgi:sterol desaturase/sphingolipid hydroxylase (fatty acid hydroxylase superfamily)